MLRPFAVSIILLLVSAVLTGCQTINPEDELLNDYGGIDSYQIDEIDDSNYGDYADMNVFPEPEKAGIYHKVEKGQTIWRIAKTYKISINDIIRTNNIPDVAEIEENQLLFIPGADAVREIYVEDKSTAREFIWPIDGKVLTYFKQRDGNRINHGINIKARPGQEIMASRTGKVVFADFLPGYGETVILDHQDGFHTVYAHNSELLVKVGEMITKQMPVALAGMDGRLAYLHFQIRNKAAVENPMFYLP